MNKKRFSQPQSKGFHIQRQTVLGLKLVYSFINFVTPLPPTYIRHFRRNCRRRPKSMVKQIQRYHIANDFIAEIRTLLI